jgi:N-acetylglucosaminyl-diphospho-decaprenol L-rhamnosyltransferase
MTGPAISAVVVAWNSAEALPTCMRSLREAERTADAPLELIVVDNGSADASVERARELGADLVISNPVNAGYGVAVAQGLARASAPWALLINPDVVVERMFIAALAAAAKSATEDVATLVPDVRFASDPTLVNCRGIEVDRAGIPADVEAGRQAIEVRAPRDVFGGSSGACLLRLEAVHEVAGVEPAFFAYGEDVDLAWGLRRAGYGALLIPGAVAYHEGSASMGGESPLKAFLVARSRRLLFRLNGPHTPGARARRTLVELAHASVVTLLGAGGAPWLGRLDALRGRRYIRFVRRSRALTDARREPELGPLRPLREALQRKLSAGREMSRDAG